MNELEGLQLENAYRSGILDVTPRTEQDLFLTYGKDAGIKRAESQALYDNFVEQRNMAESLGVFGMASARLRLLESKFGLAVLLAAHDLEFESPDQVRAHESSIRNLLNGLKSKAAPWRQAMIEMIHFLMKREHPDADTFFDTAATLFPEDWKNG